MASRGPNSLVDADPTVFIEATLGERLTAQQAAVARVFASRPRVCVTSGHGVGKSFLAARLALWFLLTRPRSHVVTSAPTWHQVRNILWKEIRRAYGKLRLPASYVTQTRIEFEPDWYAVGLSTNDATRLQGLHAPGGVCVIFDEAVGIPAEMWDAADTLVLSDSDRFLAVGNPTDPNSEMRRRSLAPNWTLARLSCRDHPNVLTRQVVVPGAVTTEWIDAKRHEYGGEDSPLFRARVLGEWPDAGEDALIRAEWVRVCEKGEVDPVVVGVDVARFGADMTVAVGIAESGDAAVLLRRRGLDTVQIAEWIAAHFAERPRCRYVVDDVGVGGGVTDQLRRKRVPVEAFNGAESASRPEIFLNRRAESYWELRERLRLNDVRLVGAPQQLIEELTALRYAYQRARLVIEPKDDVRRRLGRSPDHADALCMAVWEWRPRTRQAQPPTVYSLLR